MDIDMSAQTCSLRPELRILNPGKSSLVKISISATQRCPAQQRRALNCRHTFRRSHNQPQAPRIPVTPVQTIMRPYCEANAAIPSREASLFSPASRSTPLSGPLKRKPIPLPPIIMPKMRPVSAWLSWCFISRKMADQVELKPPAKKPLCFC